MPLPAYNPEQIDALARVFAEAALNELINEITADVESLVSESAKTNAATPRPKEARRSEGLDGADSTRIIPK
jgi:hypothetical protein